MPRRGGFSIAELEAVGTLTDESRRLVERIMAPRLAFLVTGGTPHVGEQRRKANRSASARGPPPLDGVYLQVYLGFAGRGPAYDERKHMTKCAIQSKSSLSMNVGRGS